MGEIIRFHNFYHKRTTKGEKMYKNFLKNMVVIRISHMKLRVGHVSSIKGLEKENRKVFMCSQE